MATEIAEYTFLDIKFSYRQPRYELGYLAHKYLCIKIKLSLVASNTAPCGLKRHCIVCAPSVNLEKKDQNLITI